MAEIAKSDVQVIQDRSTQIAVLTPMDMLSKAVSDGASIEVLAKLMDLRERLEAAQARKEFDEAVAAATAEIPPIVKNRKGHGDKRYADFSAIASVVDPIITKYGLSYRFRTTQTDKISVTCVLSHKAGHSEENPLSGPSDTSGSKNPIQAIGSTLAYLQRYTLIQALGLAVTEDDDGHAAGTGDTISEQQEEELKAAMAKVGSPLGEFLDWQQIGRLSDLPAKRFRDALRAVQSYKPARA
jgi:hypothetical protein